jgi:hypothetical protein
MRTLGSTLAVTRRDSCPRRDGNIYVRVGPLRPGAGSVRELP